MARGVKATEEVATTQGIETFKQAIVELGIKLADDVANGRDRTPIQTLESICNLYNAVK